MKPPTPPGRQSTTRARPPDRASRSRSGGKSLASGSRRSLASCCRSGARRPRRVGAPCGVCLAARVAGTRGLVAVRPGIRSPARHRARRNGDAPARTCRAARGAGARSSPPALAAFETVKGSCGHARARPALPAHGRGPAARPRTSQSRELSRPPVWAGSERCTRARVDREEHHRHADLGSRAEVGAATLVHHPHPARLPGHGRTAHRRLHGGDAAGGAPGAPEPAGGIPVGARDPRVARAGGSDRRDGARRTPERGAARSDPAARLRRAARGVPAAGRTPGGGERAQPRPARTHRGAIHGRKGGVRRARARVAGRRRDHRGTGSHGQRRQRGARAAGPERRIGEAGGGGHGPHVRAGGRSDVHGDGRDRPGRAPARGRVLRVHLAGGAPAGR